jgi:hypothetical protein
MQRGEEPLRLLILDCTCITVKMQGLAIIYLRHQTLGVYDDRSPGGLSNADWHFATQAEFGRGIIRW